MPYRPPARRPIVRLATAAAGLAVLGLGWKLTTGDSHAADAAALEAVIPADYVPADVASPAPAPTPVLPPAIAAVRTSPYSAPLDVLRVTSSFGWRRHPILGFTRMHQGVDFAAPTGTPVLAAADGVVTEADRDGGYGNILRLRHAGGWSTGYAHLSAFAPDIGPGVPVTRGEVIGFVGQTGLATGPHLHYEVSLDGVKLDPMKTPFGDAPTAAEAADAAAGRLTHAVVTAAAGDGLRLRPAEASDGMAPGV